MMHSKIDPPADVLLQMKELELNMLLEMIREINGESSEHNLARIYKFAVSANRHISKMAVYMLSHETSQYELINNATFGTIHQYRNLPLTDAIKAINSLSNSLLIGQPFFDEFDQVAPIYHQGGKIAYLFLGFSAKGEQVPKLSDFEFIHALCSIVVVAIHNLRTLKQKREEFEYTSQLEIAKEVQGLLIPKKLPRVGQMQVEATYQPHHRIGGDYYDCIRLDQDRWLLCIADVSGKGVPAALIMSNFQAGLRLLSKKGNSLTEIVKELNSFVAEISSEGRFITAFFAIYNPTEQSIQYVNAGHNPPFYWADGQWQRLTEGCTVLGAFSKLPFIEEGLVRAAPPLFLFAFTDGFVESPTASSGMPLDEDYLERFLTNYLYADLGETHQKLIRLIDNASENSTNSIDDITLLSLRVLV